MSSKITVTDNGFLRIDYERDGVRKCIMLDVEKLALLIEPKPKPIDGEEKSF